MVPWTFLPPSSQACLATLSNCGKLLKLSVLSIVRKGGVALRNGIVIIREM